MAEPSDSSTNASSRIRDALKGSTATRCYAWLGQTLPRSPARRLLHLIPPPKKLSAAPLLSVNPSPRLRATGCSLVRRRIKKQFSCPEAIPGCRKTCSPASAARVCWVHGPVSWPPPCSQDAPARGIGGTVYGPDGLHCSPTRLYLRPEPADRPQGDSRRQARNPGGQKRAARLSPRHASTVGRDLSAAHLPKPEKKLSKEVRITPS